MKMAVVIKSLMMIRGCWPRDRLIGLTCKNVLQLRQETFRSANICLARQYLCAYVAVGHLHLRQKTLLHCSSLIS